jgi:hypothetical protein
VTHGDGRKEGINVAHVKGAPCHMERKELSVTFMVEESYVVQRREAGVNETHM